MRIHKRNTESQYRAITFLLVVCLSVAVYLNTLTNGFVMDDRTLIVGNQSIRSLSNLWHVLLYDYRPLRTISYVLDYAVWGINPFGYHLTNILLHVLNCLCLYGIVRIIFESERIALLASLLFAVHPLHTDVVSYLSGRRDVLFSFFYLLGFCFFLSYRKRGKFASLIAVLSCFLLSMLSKEMAASFPFLLFGYDVFFLNDDGIDKVETSSLKTLGRSAISVLGRYFVFYLFLFSMLPVFAYYYIRLRHASKMVTASGVEWWGGSILSNFMTVGSVLAHDVRQTLFPIRLVADYFAYPVVTLASDPEFIRSVLVIIVLGVLFFAMCGREKKSAFSIFWFFVTLLPVMQIIPHHDLLAEHFLYLPSAGFCMLAALFFYHCLKPETSRPIVLVLFLLVVAFFSIRTWERNQDWENNVTIYRDDLAAYPGNTRVHLLLGSRYMKAHLYDMALQEFGMAEKGERFFPEAYAYDGFIHYRRGEYAKAIRLEKNALAVKKLPLAYFVLGQVYEKQEKWEDALDAFAVVQPGHYYLPAILGQFKSARQLWNISKADEAAQAYLEATNDEEQTLPRDVHILWNRALCLEWLKQFDKAVRIHETLLADSNDSKKIRHKIDELHGEASDLVRAKKLLQEQPMNSTGMMLKAKVFWKVGRYADALSILDHLQEEVLLPQKGVLLKARLLAKKDRTRTIQYLEKTIKEDGDENGALHAELGHLYAAELKLDAALTEYQQALHEGFTEPVMLASLEAVRRDRKRLRQLPPGGGLLEKAEICLHYGANDPAILFLHEAEQSRRDRDLLRIGTIYETMGTSFLRKTIQVYRQQIVECSNDAEACRRLGLIYLKIVEDLPRAYKYLSRSLQLAPRQAQALYLRKRVGDLRRIYLNFSQETGVNLTVILDPSIRSREGMEKRNEF